MSEVRFAEMISKIAHELRSPLTSVKGFSATLLSRWERFNDEQRYELIEAIHSDAERMARIVSEVLDLARLEADRLELHKRAVEVAGIIDKAIENVSSLTGADRITTDVSQDVTVLADPERLQHVVFNLVENAVKFSDTGPVEITATTDGSLVHITIQDEGVGIPSERLEVIFQGPGPTGQVAGPKGTGLGLYLSKRLAQAHGGDITVESKEAEGSTFTIVLPAAAS